MTLTIHLTLNLMELWNQPPKMVQLPAFRIGQFPYFNLNFLPSSTRYFHFFFTASLLNKLFSSQICICFQKPDFMWFFIPFFPEVWKISWGQSRISFHRTPWCDVQDHILWKQTDLNTHVEKACWKHYPELENANIYLYIYMVAPPPGTYLFQFYTLFTVFKASPVKGFEGTGIPYSL